LDIFEFLRLGDPKLRDLANLWSYKLIMNVIKLQKYHLWRQLGDVIKLRHQKYVIKW